VTRPQATERGNDETWVLAHGGEIAAALHDGVLQTLFAIEGQAQVLLADTSLPATARTTLERISELAASAGGELREAIRPLRDDPVDSDELGPALSHAVASARRRGQLAISLEVAPELATARGAAASVLYRVVREGIANAQRHARARSCAVTCLAESRRWIVRVEDDGVGPQPPSPGREHFGLAFLRAACEQLGGSLELLPRPGGGSALVAHLPAPR
jgi:NarL family two-component system sensor histidine kinase LiaS